MLRRTPAPIRQRIATTTAVIGSVSLALSTTPAVAAAPAERSSAAPGLRLAATVPPPHTLLRPAALRATQIPPDTYTIVAGDTISDIAARYGLRTADVLAANGLDWASVIHPGQSIALTATATAAEAPANEPAPVAEPAAVEHVVTAGDTLWAIATSAGIPLADLLAANGLDSGSIIYPGQSLLVPTPGAASPAPAAAGDAVPLEAEPAAVVTPITGLDAEQSENARIIIAVGRDLGVPDRGIAIALATAMVESWVRNLDWGDRDSLGLFQQRPSMGWGTPDQVRDPYRAARSFFVGSVDENGATTDGLLDIDGWESMDFGAAAQAVQISAYPDRYGVWEQDAYAWLATLG
ncbi:LysM peptidoglycan-binding domain-containing protein [Microbacterium sp. MMO-56]|uniref:LysM peptidoglycan-binding domain-containing protein n=1 Tax=unclassified Microbacterium TaxID=2609290 RepID=UPI003FA5396B